MSQGIKLQAQRSSEPVALDKEGRKDRNVFFSVEFSVDEIPAA
jgi:hypothetical protein